MKSHLLLTFIGFLCFSISAYGQKKWDDKYYEKLTDDNFRKFKLFKSPIDLDDPDYKTLDAAIFFVTNEARIEKGLKPTSYHPSLEIMAWNHSIEMGKRDFFDHFNPKQKDRNKPNQRAVLAGISNPSIAENISAVGGIKFGSYLELADYVVDGWIKSPPHAKTLYSENVLQLGCGAYYYKGKWQGNDDIHNQGDGFWISTQNFQSFSPIVSEKPKDKGPKQ